MCGTLVTSGELHHEHQAEVQLGGLAKLPSFRLLSDDQIVYLMVLLELCVQFSALLVFHTLSLYLHYGGTYY